MSESDQSLSLPYLSGGNKLQMSKDVLQASSQYFRVKLNQTWSLIATKTNR